MRVLVGCEESGVVRDAFLQRGHDAWSCDLLPSRRPGPHLQMDIRLAIYRGPWDRILLFPDCTYLCSSGLHWNHRRPERARLTEAAVQFTLDLWAMACEATEGVALENPVGCLSTRWRRPDQIIQPWEYGDDASKATCLWLWNLPPLVPTNVLPGGRRARRANQTASGQNRLAPGPDRARLRAETYPGPAAAMAAQWG